jgi:SAM-dependent methyltransferase
LRAALGAARSVLNVGAGTGSYEAAGKAVVAVDPSAVMLRQRRPGAAPAVQAVAEALPFGDASFDAVLAVLTVHHWTDRARGLEECRRVARDRVVLLTWDPASSGFWLIRDYLTDFFVRDQLTFPPTEELQAVWGPSVQIEIKPLPIPKGCVDGFLGAFWARPHAYLDPLVRGGMSSFSRAGAQDGLDRLRADLDSGAWQARYGHLLDADELDLGYQVVVANLRRSRGSRNS